MTTLDNSLKNLVEDGPVSFKPGFEFLRKTEPDVNRFIAMEREVEQIVGEDQLKQLKFKIRFEHLKKTKTVDEVWAELPEENKNVLLDMMIAKQAPKGKPLACIN